MVKLSEIGKVVKIDGKPVKIRKKKGYGYGVDKKGYLREVPMAKLRQLAKKSRKSSKKKSGKKKKSRGRKKK